MFDPYIEILSLPNVRERNVPNKRIIHGNDGFPHPFFKVIGVLVQLWKGWKPIIWHQTDFINVFLIPFHSGIKPHTTNALSISMSLLSASNLV